MFTLDRCSSPSDTSSCKTSAGSLFFFTFLSEVRPINDNHICGRLGQARPIGLRRGKRSHTCADVWLQGQLRTSCGCQRGIILMATYLQSQSMASEPGSARFIWNIFRCLSRRVLQRRRLIWEAQNWCVSVERRVAEGLRLLLMAPILKLCLWPPAASLCVCSLDSKEILFLRETSPPSNDPTSDELCCKCRRRHLRSCGGRVNICHSRWMSLPAWAQRVCLPLYFAASLKVQCVKFFFFFSLWEARLTQRTISKKQKNEGLPK